MENINVDINEKLFQIDYRENLAVASKLIEEIMMDLDDDTEINEEMRKIDLMEQDVLHMIEFVNFNAVEGYYFAKLMKDIRNERRKLKNRLEERTKARKIVNNYKNHFKAPVSDVLDNFQKLKQEQSNRGYKIKKLKELDGFNSLIQRQSKTI